MWWSVLNFNSANLSVDNPHDLDLRPSRLPEWVQRAGMLLFLGLVLLSGWWALTEHWRRATFVLGVALIWLAALRMTCDSRVIGVFAVRSRRFDVFFCLLLGGVMAWLSASADALGS